MSRDVRRALARALRYTVLVGVAALGAACGEDPAAPDPGSAQIRFVNAARTAAMVDVRWAGEEAFADVAFGAVAAGGQYRTLRAGAPVVRVFSDATTTELTFGTFFADADDRYTTALVMSGQGYTLDGLRDTAATPAAAKTKLRVVHLSLLANGNVDVYVTSPGADLAPTPPTVAGLTLRGATRYLELPAGTHQVRLTGTGNKTVILDTGTFELADGKVWTVMALDPTDGEFPLTPLILADN